MIGLNKLNSGIDTSQERVVVKAESDVLSVKKINSFAGF